jgi:uncharacterized delta-60 repeat protein
MFTRVLFLCALVLSLTAAVFALPGQLDPTFNGTGKLLTSQVMNASWVAKTMAIQADGKILVSGTVNPWNFGHAALYRYNPGGAPDTTFGSGGGVDLLQNGDFKVFPAEIKLQDDGKIVMGVATTGGCGIARLDANGAFDATFGNNGVAVMVVPGDGCAASGLAIQSDGHLLSAVKLLGPNETGISFAIMRFMPDGAPDTSFGGAGQISGGTIYTSDHVRSLLAQPDGKIVLVGETGVISKNIIYRFNNDGSADTSFGTDGRAVAGFESKCADSYSAALQPDGKIVIAGSANGDTSCLSSQINYGFEMMRFNPDGSLDQGFGANGYVFTPAADRMVKTARGLAIQPDGKILLGGSGTFTGSYPGSSYTDYAVARYSASGVLEGVSTRSKFSRLTEGAAGMLWGTDGIVRAHLIDNDYAGIAQIAFDAAGRLLIYGAYDSTTPGGKIGLVRLQGDASPYSSITGRLTTAGGMPIKNVSVILSEGELGQPRYALSNQLGYYSFGDLPVTETYSVSISSKRFSFAQPQQRLMLNHDEQSVDFIAEE